MRHFIVTLLCGFFLLGPHSFADVNARNGVSITTASTINGVTPNAAINGLTIVGGASAAWTDTFAEGGIDGDASILADSFGRITKEYALPAGTVSKLRFKVTVFAAPTGCKVMLYDSSYDLVTYGEVTVTATGVYEVDVTPVAISSANYRFGLIGNGNSDYSWGVKTLQTDASYFDIGVSYGSWPRDPCQTSPGDGFNNNEFYVGAYITP